MSVVKNLVGGIFGGGDDSSDAPIDAANIQADYQREALEYLKETEELPQEFREGALTELAGAYGLRGQDEEQAIIDRARQSPLYASIVGGRKEGEEAIMRQASATGGLRSGNIQENLYDYNTQLENQALLQSYNQQIQGLGGLAQLPSLAPAIAQGTAGIGQTLAQGEIGAAQAGQAGQQQGIGNIMGIANLGLQAYGSGMFSDPKLKDNITYVGDVNGNKWYIWDWNRLAHSLGLEGKSCGVMATEINQDSVKVKDGFLFVDYASLGVF